MIIELTMMVQGYKAIPLPDGVNGMTCRCSEYSRNVECSIGNVIDNDKIYQIVSTSDKFGEPITAQVKIECQQEIRH